jgi:alginate O-acetyltransferase complex protein AlgJ
MAPSYARRIRLRARGLLLGDAAKVLQGKDGWLFLRDDTNDVLGQHTGRVQMKPAQLEKWERVLAGRVATVRELGVPWVVQVAPDKEGVYSELLPAQVVPAPRRPVHDFLEVAARVGVPVHYPLEQLRAKAREGRPVYYVTDTHWNQFGAYVAYCEICSEAAKRGVAVPVLGESEIEWVTTETEGDLGEKLNPPRTGQTILARLRHHTSTLVADNGVANHGRVMVFEAPDSDKPTCVAFGESFANHLLIFLKESFSRLVAVHTTMLDRARLEQERPDVVLSMPLERFLIEVPDDTDAHARLEATARRKVEAENYGTTRFLEGIPEEESDRIRRSAHGRTRARPR